MKTFLVLLSILFFSIVLYSYKKPLPVNTKIKVTIKTGADQTEKYLPYLKGKRIAILANQTSIIGKRHMVDSLKQLGVNIVKVFGPEHGFRGNASNGAHVLDEVDSATGIPIISLYGAKNKPSKEDLADVDLWFMMCRMWVAAFIPILMRWPD